jgi:hypothetical protein
MPLRRGGGEQWKAPQGRGSISELWSHPGLPGQREVASSFDLDQPFLGTPALSSRGSWTWRKKKEEAATKQVKWSVFPCWAAEDLDRTPTLLLL